MQCIIKLMSVRQNIMTELSWGNRPPAVIPPFDQIQCHNPGEKGACDVRDANQSD